MWISTFGPGRRVAKLSIEPAPALDLVEVQTVGEGSEVTNLFHLERGPALALYSQLGDVLRSLWPEQFADDDGPWEVAFVETAAGRRRWVPLSGGTGQALKDFPPSEDEAAVRALVAKMNSAGENPGR